MNDNEKKLQPDNMRELDPEMLEDVTGGGVKEIVAGVTLAAMTMTSGPVSAFGLARAMAEDNGGAIVEAAPIESMEERVWESDAMMEEIVEENYAPAEVIAESFEIEAPVEEVTVFLGGEEEEIFLKEEETEAVFSAEEAAPVVPSFEVGSRKTLKLSEISRALGISSKIENVGVFNEADNAKFALFIDEDGDLAKIGNIMGNSALTDAQKLQQVADLMNNSEFTALESAMNGATKCFTSNVNDIFERQSIFEAAYARACESVMFSGEALKISTPYIARQLAVYLAAYGVMNQVYNAYEQVYGAGSLTATRQKMCERLGGVDLNGNNVGGSVGQQVKAYYGRDRYTFVNRGTANIQLRRGVLACHIVKDQWYDAHYYIDGWIQGIPLNAQQVEALCSYAASRKESLFDYLFNDVGFVPVNSPSVDVERFFPEAHPDQWANVQGSTQSGGLRKKVTSASVTCYDRVNGRWQKPAGRVAVVDGKQTLTSALDHSNRNRYIKCDLMSATDVGVSKSGMESIYVDYDYKNKWIGYRSMDLLIFQGR